MKLTAALIHDAGIAWPYDICVWHSTRAPCARLWWILVIRSPKSITKVQVWLSSLLNTVTKCGGIESGDDPKTHF